MNKKIKFVGLMLSVVTLFGLFAVTTPASAMTCDSATITGYVITNGNSTRARFTYGTNANAVAGGGGIPTAVQTFSSDGNISQFISGLSGNTTYYYRLEVTNNIGTDNGAILSFSTPACTTAPVTTPPTVNLNANPSSISSGQQSTLIWTTTNASTCTATANPVSNSWSGPIAPNISGSQIVSPTITTFYILTCSNSTSSASSTVEVYINGASPQTCQDTNAINYGGALPCRYPTPPQTCQDPNAINYRGPLPCTYPPQTCQDPSAINYRGPLPCTYPPQTCQDPSAINYGGVIPCRYPTPPQRCQDPSATNYLGTLPCTYPPQTCQDPSAINYGGTIPCRYINIQYCQDPSANNYRGPLPCTYYQTFQYCQDSSAINYLGIGSCRYSNSYYYPYSNYQSNVNIYADQTYLSYNNSTTIRWDSSNANTCYASGGTNGWSGGRNTSGSFNTGPLSYTTTFSITCNNGNNGSGYGTVTINVNGTQGIYSSSYSSAAPTAVTTIPTQLSNSSAQLNSLIFTGSYTTNAWFEWGTTAGLGNRTSATPVGAATSVSNSDTIAGLATGVTYYYRAVAQNTYGTSYGNIMSFPMDNLQGTVSNVSSTVTNRTTVITRTGTQSLVLLTIDGGIDTIKPSEHRSYNVTWKNQSTQTLRKVVLRITLPDQMNFESANKGSFSTDNKTLTLDIGTLSAGETGSMSLQASANSTLVPGKLIVVVANLVYTDQSNNQGEAVAYVTHNPDLSGSLLGANAFGAGFLPNTFFGWLLLLILLLIIVLLGRHLYGQFSQPKTPAPPPQY